MITIDFECHEGHRFLGSFRDYEAYSKQFELMMIHCPVCNSAELKRVFSGCSIHARSSSGVDAMNAGSSFLKELIKFTKYIRDNYENVGDRFAESARAIYYGMEEDHKGVYGHATPGEINELIDEGIEIVPLLNIEEHLN